MRGLSAFAGVSYIGMALDTFNFVACIKPDGIVSNAEVLNGSQVVLGAIGIAGGMLLGGWIAGVVLVGGGLVSVGIAVYSQTVDSNAPAPFFN